MREFADQRLLRLVRQHLAHDQVTLLLELPDLLRRQPCRHPCFAASLLLLCCRLDCHVDLLFTALSNGEMIALEAMCRVYLGLVYSIVIHGATNVNPI